LKCPLVAGFDLPDDIGKSKMTVMLFQLEGNDQTLQDGI